MSDVVVVSQGQGTSKQRPALKGERCANPDCVYHDVDIPEGRNVIDVNGVVYCEDFCCDEVTCGN